MAKKEKNQKEQQSGQTEKLAGLELLDDRTLAQIVDSEVSETGKLSSEGTVAFQELARRSGENV